MTSATGPENIHPSILFVVNEVRTGIMNGKLTDQKSIGAATAYCQIRAVRYSKAFALIFAGYLVLVVALAVIWLQFGKSVGITFFLLVTSGWTFQSFRLYRRTDQHISWLEIESLVPALYLSQEKIVYLQCLRAVDESRHIPFNEKLTWAKRLSATLDANALDKLIRARDALVRHQDLDSEVEQAKRELVE